MVIDRPRPRSTCSAGAGEEVSPFSVSVFCTSLLWLRHFSLGAQVRCSCRRDDSLSFFFQAVTYRCALSFWSLFLLVLGLKKKAPKRMVLKIDRRVGGSIFFLSSPLELPAIRLFFFFFFYTRNQNLHHIG